MQKPDPTGSLDRRQLLLCGGALVAGLALRAGRARGSEGALFVSCRIDAEADDVHGIPLPRDRNLAAVDESNAGLASRDTRIVESRDLVVIGQRNHVDSARCRAADHVGRGQNAVGASGMAVQVVAEHGTRLQGAGRDDPAGMGITGGRAPIVAVLPPIAARVAILLHFMPNLLPPVGRA